MRGSEWLKWDLQIQPTEQGWFQNVPNEDRYRNKVKSFLEELVRKGIKVISITDHNYGKAIDIAQEIINREKFDINILPGVELTAKEGWHILIVLNPEYKEKNKCDNWSDAIKNFLNVICQISITHQSNGIANQITGDTVMLLKRMYNEDLGILIFAHCTSGDGFFQRGNKQTRKDILESNLPFILDIKCEICDFDDKKEEVYKTIKDIINNSKCKIEIPIIVSSDSHSTKEIGEKFTWIKANPTYRGLKQILYDYNERVFVGENPAIFNKVEQNKTKYIDKLIVNKVKDSEIKSIWFEKTEVELSKELVAIIGNKGGGKSALVDILGLLGNTKNSSNFSFLTNQKFRHKDLAKNFEATLVWESKEKNKKNLNGNVDISSVETVKYIPQNFFEQLCNEKEEEFKKELQTVIFSHLDEAKRLGKNSFDELIKYKTENVVASVRIIKSSIDKINQEIIELEIKRSPIYRKSVENFLNQKKQELEVHFKIKPREVPKPKKDTKEAENISKEVGKLNDEISVLQKEVTTLSAKKVNFSNEINELDNLYESLGNLEISYQKFKEENIDKCNKFGIKINEIAKLNINKSAIAKAKKEREILIIGIDKKTSNDLEKLSIKEKSNNLLFIVKEKEKLLEKLKNKLSEPNKKYQNYLTELKKWNSKQDEIEGNDEKDGTLNYYESVLKYLDDKLDDELYLKQQERISKSLEIYEKRRSILFLYEELKKAVDKFIVDNKELLVNYNITLNTSFNLGNFVDNFFEYINQSMSGSFYGVENGEKQIKGIVENFNFNRKGEIKQFLETIIKYLENDKRKEFSNQDRNMQEQIKSGKLLEFYNFVFNLDYLNETYELKLDGKSLSELSPGEKGSLLLVFYLMLDKNDIPLVIDQPEDNLDNESISKILVPFMRKAKKKRQIIMVTHNPNLAIVADAEQIIYININKANKNKIEILSGAIENPLIKEKVVDVLEGTMPAFDKRRLKYLIGKEFINYETTI